MLNVVSEVDAVDRLLKIFEGPELCFSFEIHDLNKAVLVTTGKQVGIRPKRNGEGRMLKSLQSLSDLIFACAKDFNSLAKGYCDLVFGVGGCID